MNEKIYNNSDLLQHTDIYRNTEIFPNDYSESWYQHNEKHNYMMHFLSFMDSTTFSRIQGFSYDYCYGTDYDDNDWLLNIVSKCVTITPVDNITHDIGGIHLCHNKSLSGRVNLLNRELFMNKLLVYNNYKKYVNFTNHSNTEYTKKYINLIIDYPLEVEQTQFYYKNLNIDYNIIENNNDNIIKLTILVPTVPSRINNFYPNMMNSLLKQINGRQDIELIALFDNEQRTIGTKRQEMIDISQGEYITFIDDDDRISDDYISSIMECLYKNENVDCVVYNVICCVDNNNKKICKYGIEFEYGDILDGSEWRGKPAHTMVWKSDIIKKHKYSDKKHGEDSEWVSRAWKDIKSQVRIDRVLYYYDANYQTTSETAGLSDDTIKKNIKKLLDNK